MLDSETIDLLPQFLSTVADLGFSQEHTEEEDCLVFTKKQPIKMELLVFPKLGIWLLSGDDDLDGDGNFNDWNVLEAIVTEA
ncbi:MAG: hypothetical protein QHH75_10395 [Bacillota bacterium]|nr:hypothetical protein [Bacillota bacterium]